MAYDTYNGQILIVYMWLRLEKVSQLFIEHLVQPSKEDLSRYHTSYEADIMFTFESNLAEELHLSCHCLTRYIYVDYYEEIGILIHLIECKLLL